MILTAEMTPEERTLQADRETWDALLAALPKYSEQAGVAKAAITQALERATIPDAVRVTLDRETADWVLAR